MFYQLRRSHIPVKCLAIRLWTVSRTVFCARSVSSARYLQHRCSPTERLVVGQDDANDIAQLVSAIFLHAVAICGALFHCHSGLPASLSVSSVGISRRSTRQRWCCCGIR